MILLMLLTGLGLNHGQQNLVLKRDDHECKVLDTWVKEKTGDSLWRDVKAALVKTKEGYLVVKIPHSSALRVSWSAPIIFFAIQVILFASIYSDSSSVTSSM